MNIRKIITAGFKKTGIYDSYINSKIKKIGEGRVPLFREIRIENTNICHYHCVCCPRERLSRPLGIMKLDEFKFVLKKLKEEIPFFSGNVHLHGYGEPLLDPDLPEKMSALRLDYPKCISTIITTLGVERKREYFETLITNGLNNINVSLYSVKKDTYAQIHGFDGIDTVTRNLITLIDIWHKQPTFSVNINSIPMEWYEQNSYKEETVRNDYLNFFESIKFPFKRKIRILKFHNYGSGKNFQKANPHICSVAWGTRRGILQITYDLKVIPCCFDYNAEIVWGDLRDSSLKDIFNDFPYLNFIKAHKEYRADCFSICKNCDTK